MYVEKSPLIVSCEKNRDKITLKHRLNLLKNVI